MPACKLSIFAENAKSTDTVFLFFIKRDLILYPIPASMCQSETSQNLLLTGQVSRAASLL